MHKSYELVPHTADLKIYAYGITHEELFKNALRGMFAAIKPQGPAIDYADDDVTIRHYTSERAVTVRSLDIQTLLVDFLSECLYLSDVYDEAYFDARFNLLTPQEVDALIFGVSISGFEVVEIKAVTYHDLQLEQIDGVWRATLVFDI